MNFTIKPNFIVCGKIFGKEINNYAKIIMVVGPECGISDREEEFLCNNNYNRVSFGDLIFRVETAAIYAASIFNFYGSKR